MITLKTLAQATAQEIFDQVAAHLLTQNERAGERFDCKYRIVTVNGRVLKCAAGCLIADDEYNPKFENRMWGSLGEWYSNFSYNYVDLISELQGIHDSRDVQTWKECLINLANYFSLSTTVLDQFT